MTASETSQAAAVIGIQLNGNARIGTFVLPGADAETVSDAFKSGAEAHPRSIESRRGFETARRKAEQLFNCGQKVDASQALIDALEQEDRVERERREDHKQLRLLFLEEAVRYDQKSECAEAAVGKLRQIAEIVHPGDQKAQITYLGGRAAKYREIGKTRADSRSALLVAVEVFSWLAEDKR